MTATDTTNKLSVLFLNCTLKQSPATSNTDAFIAVASNIFNKLDVATETIRVVDHHVSFGNTSDEKGEDEWPKILERIYACDMLIIATPIWRGDRSSVAKMVVERMDGIMSEGNDENGQYPTFNKVAGIMVDGNEDGAKKASASIMLDLSEQGFTLPVNAFTYYVGKAGPGPSYIEAGGDKHFFTNNMTLLMVHNMLHLAKNLKVNPYRTDVTALKKVAKQMSE
ncbi:flavodoxin family protein [Methylophaga pinxianii]|uniref:flavodoxin family protein n=1 Tax=Methylophaga pinxianii TaxID=2881052 RepID=UPI001CF4739F|nr:NAD(P)H-dependent oxidoreductase [Methylophaga pinxianii]MCB2426568.1 NAD(P)H-dependent oxidoreductase [Methylophaga pinxianii]UPH44869.1 NAD(P)H-dependent oxidoreductase [Methylophaga pinxianii]